MVMLSNVFRFVFLLAAACTAVTLASNDFSILDFNHNGNGAACEKDDLDYVCGICHKMCQSSGAPSGSSAPSGSPSVSTGPSFSNPTISPRTSAPTPAPGPPPVPAPDLGSACGFGILTKTGCTNIGIASPPGVITIGVAGYTEIIGNMGISPIATTAFTGFAYALDGSLSFATSAMVNGRLYGADMVGTTAFSGETTAAYLTKAILDMQAAYTDAHGRTPVDYTNLKAGLIEGEILTPGIYRWTSTVSFASKISFSGSATDVWILQITGTFDAPSYGVMELLGGAKAENIYWAIADVVALGTYSQNVGTFLAQTMIALKTGSSLRGSALAQTAVTLDSVTIAASECPVVPTP